MELIRQICVNRISKDIVGYFMRNFAVDSVIIYWYSQEHNVVAAYNPSSVDADMACEKCHTTTPNVTHRSSEHTI